MHSGPGLYHWTLSPTHSLASCCHSVGYYLSLWLTKIITVQLIPVSFLLLWFKNIHTKGNWWKNGFIWISVLMGESRGQSNEVISHICCQEQEWRDGCMQATQLAFFYSNTQPQEMMLPTFRLSLSISFYVMETIFHRHAHKLVWSRQSLMETFFPTDPRLYHVDNKN